MPGCFGRRKKKNKDLKPPESSEKANSSHHGNDRTQSVPASAAGEPDRASQQKLQQQQLQKQQQLQQKQQQATPQATVAPQQPGQQEPDEIAPEVTEAITVTRSHSVQHAQSRPGNIKKAATMSRYDFLRKQDGINYADRWAALRQRYLAPVAQGDAVKLAPPPAPAQNGPGKPQLRATALSLPRQFAPASAAVSPVKFSGWFYERQTREAEARRESQLREERMRKIIEGPSSEEMEEAAVKIQAGYKGYRTRKEIHAKKEMQPSSP